MMIGGASEGPSMLKSILMRIKQCSEVGELPATALL